MRLNLSALLCSIDLATKDLIEQSLLFLTGFFLGYLIRKLFTMRHFTAKQLHEHLAQPDTQPLLLDVREQWEFDYCSLKDSILIPMGQLPYELETLAAEIGLEREIIMICHHGIRSRQMGYYMEQAGFKNITNLDGGVEQWAEDVDKTMKRY